MGLEEELVSLDASRLVQEFQGFTLDNGRLLSSEEQHAIIDVTRLKEKYDAIMQFLNHIDQAYAHVEHSDRTKSEAYRQGMRTGAAMLAVSLFRYAESESLTRAFGETTDS